MTMRVNHELAITKGKSGRSYLHVSPEPVTGIKLR